MRFHTVPEWLQWQEQLHPQTMLLGLDRVARVWQRLQPARLTCPIITVGGTNGKGSCVALLDAILGAAGYRVGAYFSPHLSCYNERIRMQGADVDAARLCAAFDRVDQARQDIILTYFEFGTLAALELFATVELDAVILEVGLGGRLDAVNVLDADVALVTSIGLDHTAWLGGDLNRVAVEKAGIFRPDQSAVIGQADAPSVLAQTARALGAQVYQAGAAFYPLANGRSEWTWHGPNQTRYALPRPNLRAARQLDNAAAVLMVLACLDHRLPVNPAAIRTGLINIRLPGRLQIIPGPVDWVLDVAHNVPAMQYLVQDLAAMPAAKHTHAVFACLADKDTLGLLQALAPAVDYWHFATLVGPRAQSAHALAAALSQAGINTPHRTHASMLVALDAVQTLAVPGDRVLVTGSFLTVAAALAHPHLHPPAATL